MKVQIRRSIFETNSSSTHSIVIRRGTIENTGIEWFYHDENNNIILEGGEFGWEEEIYYDPQTKANYVAVGIMHILDEEFISEYSVELVERYKKYKEMLTKVLKEVTGCNDVIYDIFTEYSNNRNWSYIDHQSEDEFLYALEDEETLKSFIFGADSRLITGNDNS